MMKFISVRDLRTTPAQVWKDLDYEKEIVITNNGRPIALLTPLSEENLEESLKAVRQARAIAAIKKIQASSIREGKNKITEEEIEREIAETRKDRSK
jgi:antitoxin (DNA-binding transcriptional repressor) of toxin-antitoxin stability system